MKTLITATLMLSVTCLATLAAAQQAPHSVKPPPMEQTSPSPLVDPAHAQTSTAQPAATLNPAQFGDARSLANDRDVGLARRAYRAQCQRGETVAFCECVTAGVAQTLMPEEVRIAARGVRERMSAQGDAASSEPVDATPEGMSTAARIVEVEGQYSNACSQFRGE